jgi:hypothetical protein
MSTIEVVRSDLINGWFKLSLHARVRMDENRNGTLIVTVK